VDSPLRNPWGVAGLAALAVAFLAWRLAPLVGGRTPEPASEEPSTSVVVASEPSDVVVDSVRVLPPAVRWDDSLGGWDVSGFRDPFQRAQGRIRDGGRRPQAGTGPSSGSSAKALELRGLATGSTNLVLAQGRVLAEGDSFAGGVLRAIRSDRIVIRRPSSDTEIFLPRRFQP